MASAVPLETLEGMGFSPCYGAAKPQCEFECDPFAGTDFLRHDKNQHGTPPAAV